MLYIYMCFCTITKENHQAPCFQIWTHFQLHNSGLVLSRISQLTSRLQWSVDSWLPPTNPSINTRVFHKLAVKEPLMCQYKCCPGKIKFFTLFFCSTYTFHQWMRSFSWLSLWHNFDCVHSNPCENTFLFATCKH